MLARLLYSLGTFVIVFLVALVLLSMISALLPGVSINATGWAVFLGVLAGALHFVKHRDRNDLL